MNDKFDNAVEPQIRTPKKAGKTIPALALLSFGAGLQCATQFFAHQFHCQAALGVHLQYLYVPWALLGWAQRWYRMYPAAFFAPQ
jgi:type IV secretion system protein VirD4